MITSEFLTKKSDLHRNQEVNRIKKLTVLLRKISFWLFDTFFMLKTTLAKQIKTNKIFLNDDFRENFKRLLLKIARYNSKHLPCIHFYMLWNVFMATLMFSLW